MIKLQYFLKYLSNPAQLRAVDISYIGKEGEMLEVWKLNLSLKSWEQQYIEVEQVLSDLLVADIEDNKRMKIMLQMQAITQRLISHIHKEYIHEASILNPKQLIFLENVKSMYYLSALIYEGILSRQVQNKQISSDQKSHSFTKFFLSSQLHNQVIKQAIYLLMNCYLHLLMEDALLFEKTSDTLWQQLNYLYLYSLQENIAMSRIADDAQIYQANSIHELYIQACIYSLFRPASYKRKDVVSLHQILIKWSKKVTLSSDANSDSKIFVDLNSSTPPSYLTPYSTINPYEENNVCLFIDIEGLLSYLEEIQEDTHPDYQAGFESRLARLAQYGLHQKQFKLRAEARYATYQDTLAVTGLYRVHYHLSGKQSFAKLIHQTDLPMLYHPKASMALDVTKYKATTPITVLDKSDSGYRFSSNHRSALGGKSKSQGDSLLKIFTLFALIPNPNNPETKWQLGMIRWIDHQDDSIQVGSKLIAYSATACGVRLDTSDSRSLDFVPALLIAGNDLLGSKTTIILPHYHFKTKDPVVLRIDNKETKLRLLSMVKNTDDIQQYEIIRLTNG